MAIVLKEGKSIPDPTGVDAITTAYGVIDQCNGNKGHKVKHFVLEIYRSKAARDAKISPIRSRSFDVTGDAFDTWFGIEALEGSNEIKQAYLYALQYCTSIIEGEEPIAALCDWTSAP